MQPGANPFGPAGQNPFNAYQVNTTAQFADEVVPAVPAGPPPQQASHGGAWGPPQQPGAAWGQQPQQHVALQFTETTAQQYVSGTMHRGEERQNLVHGTRSDDPASSSAGPYGQPFGQQPGGPPGGEPFPQAPAAGAAAPSGGAAPKDDHAKYPFYNVRRYRDYFDVDTNDVLWRVGNSMIGVFRPNFMEVTHKQPDLYGPFWAATTLIFITAVAGNFARYIEWRRSIPSPPPPASPPPSAPPLLAADAADAGAADGGGVVGVVGRLLLAASDPANDQWFTDYTKLATSAALFYGYVFIVGLICYFTVKWFKGELKLVNVLCIYGYSLTIFVPVSIACVVPIDGLRWALVMTATALSAGFLFMNFRATIYSAAPARASLVLLGIVLAHIGLGLALKLYFFQY